jgi:hypothetical protein
MSVLDALKASVAEELKFKADRVKEIINGAVQVNLKSHKP